MGKGVDSDGSGALEGFRVEGKGVGEGEKRDDPRQSQAFSLGLVREVRLLVGVVVVVVTADDKLLVMVGEM